MRMRMFCFGDSNTYGYDARSMLGERLLERERWPEILGKLSGWEVINEGMNGREIPESPWFLERFDHLLSESAPVDFVFLMLGSNDLLNAYRPDMEEIGIRMERFIKHVLKHPTVNGRGEKVFSWPRRPRILAAVGRSMPAMTGNPTNLAPVTGSLRNCMGSGLPMRPGGSCPWPTTEFT